MTENELDHIDLENNNSNLGIESESLKNQIALITEDYEMYRKQTENKINLLKLD